MWRSRLAYAAILLAALGLYLFENGAGTRVLLVFLLVLPLVSALVLYLPRGAAAAALALPASLRRGAEAAGTLTVKNTGALPLWRWRAVLTLENRMTGERSSVSCGGFLAARAERTLPLTLCAAHCGALAVSLDALSALDPLGLFSRPLRVSARASVPILPKRHPLSLTLGESADALFDAQTYSTQKPGYDPSEIFRIRAYAPGDPIRQIHWKLTEKTGKTLVRDLGLPVVARILLLTETTSAPRAPLTPEGMDAQLDLLASLCDALLRRETEHTVGWYDARQDAWLSQEVRAPADLPVLWTRLLDAPIAAEGERAAARFLACHAVCPYAHVAVLAPAPEEEGAALARGSRVTWLSPAGEALALAGAESVDVLPYSPAALARGELQFEL